MDAQACDSHAYQLVGNIRLSLEHYSYYAFLFKFIVRYTVVHGCVKKS